MRRPAPRYSGIEGDGWTESEGDREGDSQRRRNVSQGILPSGVRQTGSKSRGEAKHRCAAVGQENRRAGRHERRSAHSRSGPHRRPTENKNARPDEGAQSGRAARMAADPEQISSDYNWFSGSAYGEGGIGAAPEPIRRLLRLKVQDSTWSMVGIEKLQGPWVEQTGIPAIARNLREKIHAAKCYMERLVSEEDALTKVTGLID